MRRLAVGDTVQSDTAQSDDSRSELAATAIDDAAPAAQMSSEPAPVDAEVAAQSEMLETVAAAVIETVIAATIEPTLPEVSAPGAASAADADALEVTVVDERRTADADVAVILQSADTDVATTPVALPTSPITLPVTRRARRRPQAAVIIDSTQADDASPAVEIPDAASPEGHGVPATPTATDDDSADEFASAARLFAFTGETAVQRPAPVATASEPVVEGLPAAAAAPRTRRNVRRIATASFSVGVMGVVGLLTVGMTMPVSALASANGTDSVTAPATATTRLALGGDVQGGDATDAIQAYVAPAQAQAAVVDRADGYSATTYAKMAADSGITNPSNFYVNDPTAPIQWPFAVGVPITYGFGMRDGTMHEGADFVPGEGSPVQAIADGTVRIATEQGGAFGVTVLIDHEIDGQLVSSRYGHMQYGSLQVTQGQHVKVGQFLGRTGNTGRSFGAHTHVEILQNGTTPIDPIVWLRQHAGG